MDLASKNNYKFICFTSVGRQLMEKILDLIPGDEMASGIETLEKGGLPGWISDNFKKGNILVFIGAMGIAVRAIAPYVSDKATDAAVIVIDEEGKDVVPVLSGHLGGGVASAKMLSELIGAECVITTASDVRGEFAVDVFAKDNDLCISDMKKAKAFTAYLLEKEKAHYLIDPEFEDVLKVRIKRDNLTKVKEDVEGSFTISPRSLASENFQLIPKCIVFGVGCRKGKAGSELIDFAKRVLEELSLDKRSIAAVTSIDIKNDEEGII